MIDKSAYINYNVECMCMCMCMYVCILHAIFSNQKEKI